METTWPHEIAAEVFAILLARWQPIALTAVVLAVAGFAQRWISARARLGSACGAVALATAVGLWQAWSIKWLADDAFISFTYALRFVEGDGFVHNAGEYVEGYTNFLWVLYLGIAGALGASIPQAAILTNLGAFVALVALAWALVSTASTEETRGALPLAALAVALGRPFQVFGTSGLESNVALALCALGVWRWRRGGALASGVFLALAAIARPDHLLLAVALWATIGLDAWLAGERAGAVAQRVADHALPTLVVFNTWWAWRWWYYGDFFPNTFYAKSVGVSYLSQGYVYLVHGFLVSGVALAALGVLGASPWVLRDVTRRPLVLYALFVFATHGVYVMEVGGDFMEFRFWLPTFFFTLVAFDVSSRPVWFAWPAWAGVAVAAPLSLAWVLPAAQVRPIGPLETKWYLAAEETFYPIRQVFPDVVPDSELAAWGHDLDATFVKRGVTPRFATGRIGMVGYYGRLPLVDTMGLTNRRIARSSLLKRGRPGHERWCSGEDVFAEGAVMSDAPVWPGREAETRFHAGGYSYHLVRYDAALEALARADGWAFPWLEKTVTEALTARTSAQLDEDRAFLERFLDGYPNRTEVLAQLDEARVVHDLVAIPPNAVTEEAFAETLRRAEGFTVASLVSGLTPRVVERFTFEDDRSLQATRDMVSGPDTTLGGVRGFVGQRFLDTFRDGDLSVGTLTVALPEGVGLRLNFLLAGSDDCARVAAVLKSEGRVLARWCGRGDPVLRPVQASLDGLVAPTLELVDQSAEPGGHLVADDVMVFRVAP